MPLKLKVQLEGKDSDYERKRPPMLENLLDALKIQRLETEMFGGKEGPTDEQNAKRMDLYAEFAARFWGQGLTKEDILKGVSAVDGFNQMVAAVNLTLGYNAEEDNKGKKVGKKITVEMIDDSIKSLTDFIKDQIKQGYTWNEISKLTLADLKLMDYVFEEKKTTIDKAFPFLF